MAWTTETTTAGRGPGIHNKRRDRALRTLHMTQAAKMLSEQCDTLVQVTDIPGSHSVHY